MGKGHEQILFIRRRAHGQLSYEKKLNITIIREMQIKTTVRYLAPVRKAIIKKKIPDADEDSEKEECSYTVGGYKLISYYGRLWRFLKKLTIESSIPLLGICPKEKKEEIVYDLGGYETKCKDRMQ